MERLEILIIFFFKIISAEIGTKAIEEVNGESFKAGASSDLLCRLVLVYLVLNYKFKYCDFYFVYWFQ